MTYSLVPKNSAAFYLVQAGDIVGQITQGIRDRGCLILDLWSGAPINMYEDSKLPFALQVNKLIHRINSDEIDTNSPG